MNNIEFTEIEKSLISLKNISEEVRDCLNNMNNMIIEGVGVDGYAWSGESASFFRNSWDNYAKDIPIFMRAVEDTANNLEIALNKIKELDTEN